MTEALTRKEATAFDEYEAVIDRGLKTFAEVGNALLAIRDARLYRDEYGTFEAYCKERWGMSRRRAYQLVDAAAVIDNVNHGTQTPPPESERQARPLAKLPPEQQSEAWQAATDKAASEGRKVTARDVETEVETRVTKTTEVMQEKKQHKGSTQDTIRFHEIASDVSIMVNEAATLNLPNADRAMAVAALQRVQVAIDKAIATIRRLQ